MGIDTFEIDEFWDISPERPETHPYARELLTEEFFWDRIDENAPFGGSLGHDILLSYVEWRNEGNRDYVFQNFCIEVCLKPSFSKEEITGIFLAISRLQTTSLPDGICGVIIATAFAQLIFEGKIEDELLSYCLNCIDILALPKYINYWIPEIQVQRKERLGKMKEVFLRYRENFHTLT